MTLKDHIQSSIFFSMLKKEDLDLLIPHLHPISVQTGMVFYEPGDVVKYAYFPCGSTLISFMVMLDDARAVETAMIGREGAVGGIVSQGRLPAYCRIVAQFSGPALRIDIADLEKAKAASPALHNFFARYADCLMAQIFQSVACNATHTIEQRTAKWLTAVQERTNDCTIPLTHEQIAGMLGVGRSYVGRIVGGLKAQGILQTARGRLIVKDSHALKTQSCACNDLVRDHFNNVLKSF